jgi:hypothetical protein
MTDAPLLPPLRPVRTSNRTDFGVYQAHWWARACPGLALGLDIGTACIAMRDPSTAPLAIGHRCFPPGIRDSRDRRLAALKVSRPQDCLLLEAEQSMVANAALGGHCLAGASAYIWPFISGPSGAAALISSGCTTVVVPRIFQPGRCKEQITQAHSVLAQAGVRYLEVPCPHDLLEDP